MIRSPKLVVRGPLMALSNCSGFGKDGCGPAEKRSLATGLSNGFTFAALGGGQPVETTFSTNKLVEGPHQNGFVESFNGRLRDEWLNEHLFPTIAAADGSSRHGVWTTTPNVCTEALAGWRPPILRTAPPRAGGHNLCFAN